MSSKTSTKSTITKLENQRKAAWRNFYEKQTQLVQERRDFQKQLKVLKSQLNEVQDGTDSNRTIEGIIAFVQREIGDIQSKLECPVCQTANLPASEVTITKCGHCFCSNCFKTWIKSNDTCPICRFNLKFNKDESE